jgi:hypothetical protein
LAVAVETDQHLATGELGADIAGRRIELEATPLDELHRCCCGDRLGHREEHTDGVDGHRLRTAELAFSERSFVPHTVAIHDVRHDTGNRATVHTGAQHCVETVAIDVGRRHGGRP